MNPDLEEDRIAARTVDKGQLKGGTNRPDISV
jgi:hypothetical protein